MNYIKKLTKQQKILAGIVALIILLLGARVFGGGASDTDNTQKRIVKVSVFELHSTSTHASIPSTGKIESLAGVDVKAQISERITSVPVSIGDTVWAGSVLATLNTSDVAAQRDLAQANLDAALAGLRETKTGARPEQLSITQSQVSSAQIAYNNALGSAINSIQNAYVTLDDTITNKTDIMLENPHSESPRLLFLAKNFQSQVDIISTRTEIEKILAKTPEYSDIYASLEDARNDVNTVITYLTTLSNEVNKLSASGDVTQTMIETWKANTSLARTTMSGTLTSLFGAEEKLSLSESSLEVAQNQLTLTQAGATTDQIAAAEAQANAAEAGLYTAQLQLAKTSVRSPIAGTVSNTFVKVGDLVTPGQTIATIVNTSGLKVTAFVNERDIALLDIGAPVFLDNTQIGTVARVAPSINPDTKKVEIEVAINPDTPVDFVIGQFISIDVAISSNLTTVPLLAIKTAVEGSFVYSIEDGVATAHPVTIERIFGDFVYLQENLASIDNIIGDARGIKQGDLVEITQ